MAKTDLNRLV